MHIAITSCYATTILLNYPNINLFVYVFNVSEYINRNPIFKYLLLNQTDYYA